MAFGLPARVLQRRTGLKHAAATLSRTTGDRTHQDRIESRSDRRRDALDKPRCTKLIFDF